MSPDLIYALVTAAAGFAGWYLRHKGWLKPNPAPTPAPGPNPSPSPAPAQPDLQQLLALLLKRLFEQEAQARPQAAPAEPVNVQRVPVQAELVFRAPSV
jgi:hypothetical protein